MTDDALKHLPGSQKSETDSYLHRGREELEGTWRLPVVDAGVQPVLDKSSQQ